MKKVVEYAVGKILRRLGSLAGSGAAGLAFDHQQVETIEAAAMIIIGVLVDFAISALTERKGDR